RQLFGGAITTELPEAFIDASDLRQIPDNQEVFLSPVDDVTFIVEILEKVEEDNLLEAAKFHFDSLAHDNDAQNNKSIEQIIPSSEPSTQERPAPILLSGTQRIKKFNRTTADDVLILLALWRLDKYNIDLVLSCNIPVKTDSPETTIVGAEVNVEETKSTFAKAVGSFKIVDFGLF
ncbi:Mog1p/PsbP-like protein, partial [Cantharellus anzutake]|uniref:Mog1p/PsbP-like protein n=1 Tax=Cantharellus anzutake TaxID=1750568 RepID=UPI0019089561